MALKTRGDHYGVGTRIVTQKRAPTSRLVVLGDLPRRDIHGHDRHRQADGHDRSALKADWVWHLTPKNLAP
jgi:hypothetical protein